jgi:hypothetical protein
MARVVILYYDYLLTLNDEIRFLWPAKRLTVMTSVYYMNRYITLLGHLPLLFGRHLLSLSSEKGQVSPRL